jgi:hypothetical protein
MVVGASSVANFAPTTAQFFANVISPQFIGNGSQLTSITGSNVVGAVANATFATNADSAVTAISANNATTADIVVANSQPNITSVGTLNSLQVTGNISTSESFIGNGSALTGLTGSQITGPVASANTAISADTATTATTAITITANSQPNITSVGTLTSLISSGNIRAANIQSDNYQYANGQPFVPDAGVTQLIAGTGIILNPASGIGQVTISSDGSSNVDVIAISSGTTNLGIPIPGGNINMVVGASSVANFAPSMAQFFANVTSPNFIGNGRALTGLIGSQITGAVDSANTAATVTTNSQPNITSVGTLANLTSTGNIVSTGGFFLGDGGRLSNIGGATGGVSRIIAGTNITISPVDGTGNVTVSATGNLSATSISNGSTSIEIPTAGGNIEFVVNNIDLGQISANAIAFGQGAGGPGNTQNQFDGAVAIGYQAAGNSNPQQANAIAIGYQAGFTNQGNRAVALGERAASTRQASQAVAIGSAAGSLSQGAAAVAIGAGAGGFGQGGGNTLTTGFDAVAIGTSAGSQFQGRGAVAIGENAGSISQGDNGVGPGGPININSVNCVAIGSGAGYYRQGKNSVCIGSGAGFGNVPANIQGAANNTIILNATDNNLDQTIANTFTVKPIRGNATVTNLNKLYYNTVSGEIQYFTTVGSADNVMSIDTARATPGSAGQTIAISDATPANRPAYWSTSSWLYVNDNSAV